MIPWEKLGSARIPGNDAELRLMRRGRDYSIMLGREELMNSRLRGSEVALARLAIERLGRGKRRILIGGLGMGFTLRAALAALGPQDRVEVAELAPAVLEWARGPMADLFGDCLDDPRVTILPGDVAAPIRAASGLYDAILLDVDNGPEGMSRGDNDLLYGGSGLAAAMRALKRGGVLAVWSAAPDERFKRTLGRTGFTVEEKHVAASPSGKGPRHVIWLARPERGG